MTQPSRAEILLAAYLLCIADLGPALVQFAATKMTLAGLVFASETGSSGLHMSIPELARSQMMRHRPLQDGSSSTSPLQL
ncbi:MAG: hypothetical protein J5J06_12770 [Phycisphaerae bacterium]|nr:hypothetical protein [Phycisphaerae bacterium]